MGQWLNIFIKSGERETQQLISDEWCNRENREYYTLNWTTVSYMVAIPVINNTPHVEVNVILGCSSCQQNH